MPAVSRKPGRPTAGKIRDTHPRGRQCSGIKEVCPRLSQMTTGFHSMRAGLIFVIFTGKLPRLEASANQLRDSQPTKRMPECDRLLQVVSAAGPRGISRNELGQEIQLDPDMLDELLAAFHRLGQIAITQQGTDQIVRSTAFSLR